MSISFNDLNLHALILKAIVECGYTNPTPVQAAAIPQALQGRDLVVKAQTGTGKTAGFTIPALQRLASVKGTHKPRILILTPTRELATQVTKSALTYGKFLKLNIISLLGGMPYRQQIRDLSRPVDIIVATPGRLIDHVKSGRLDLKAIEMLILDEADRMLDMGFVDDVKAIAAYTPPTRQTLLFSATVDSRLSSIIKQITKDPAKIEFASENMSPTQITQSMYLTDNIQHKMRLLQHFLTNENIFKGIIFSATKINADTLANQLQDKGFEAAALHGDLKQNVRNRTIDQLRRGRVQFLVATDVAARGIDISDITHVFNFDVPKFSEDYVHRIGRTGRAGKTGIAISFALPADTKHVKKIERYIGKSIPMATVEGLEPTKKFMQDGASSSSRNARPKRNYQDGGQSRFKRPDNAASRGFAKRTAGKTFEPRRSEARPFTNTRDDDRGNKAYAPKRTEGRDFSAPRPESRSFAPKRNDANGSVKSRDFSSPRGEARSFAPKRAEGKSFAPKREGRNFSEKRGEAKPYSAKGKSFAPKRAEAKHFDTSRSETRGTVKVAYAKKVRSAKSQPKADHINLS